MRKTETLNIVLTTLLCITLCGSVEAQTKQGKQKAQKKEGYTNTPVIPGQKWKVHDADRPHPEIIKPGTASTESVAGKAPSDAVIHFDGKNLDAWKGRKGDARWLLKGDHIQCKPGSGAISTRQQFGDCQLHIEWSSPTPVKGKSQGRGNSGVFLMGNYEVQVLDSYNNVTYADGQAGAIYGQTPPLVNASRKPGTWQMYDIIFKAPRFKDGKLVSPAYVTILHNGVLLHHHRALIGATTHKRVGTYKAHGPKGPIQLQDHGNAIRYRNIWVRELKGYDQK